MSVGVGVGVCVGRGVLVGRGVGVLVGPGVEVGTAVWVAVAGMVVMVEVTSAGAASGRANSAVSGRAANGKRAMLPEANIPARAFCAAETGADAGALTARTPSIATPINVYGVTCITIPPTGGPQKTKSPQLVGYSDLSHCASPDRPPLTNTGNL